MFDVLLMFMWLAAMFVFREQIFLVQAETAVRYTIVRLRLQFDIR